MPFEQPVLDVEPARLNTIIEHAPLSHTDPSHPPSGLSLDINRQLFQEETPVPDFPAPHMPVLSEEYFQLALKFQKLGGGKVQEFVRTGSYELELPCTRFPLSHADVLICRLQPPTKAPRSIQRQRRERSVSVWMLARDLPSKTKLFFFMPPVFPTSYTMTPATSTPQLSTPNTNRRWPSTPG